MAFREKRKELIIEGLYGIALVWGSFDHFE